MSHSDNNSNPLAENAPQSFERAGAFHRVMRRFAGTGLGAALFKPTAHHFDRLIAKLTRGRYSFVGVAAGLPVAMLTTTGAKSGQLRTVPVIAIPFGNSVGLIASNFGGRKHPGWYHNLSMNPQATLAINGASWNVIARRATPDERIELWDRGVTLYPAYDAYEGRAKHRQIEAFILTRT